MVPLMFTAWCAMTGGIVIPVPARDAVSPPFSGGLSCGVEARHFLMGKKWKVVLPEYIAGMVWEIQGHGQSCSQAVLSVEEHGVKTKVRIAAPRQLENYIKVEGGRQIHDKVFRDGNIFSCDENVCIMMNEWYVNVSEYAVHGDHLIGRKFPMLYCVRTFQ